MRPMITGKPTGRAVSCIMHLDPDQPAVGPSRVRSDLTRGFSGLAASLNLARFGLGNPSRTWMRSRQQDVLGELTNEIK